ncbi:MAG: Ig-like domain-containing protein [Steroidobacteraceae bacterium]
MRASHFAGLLRKSGLATALLMGSAAAIASTSTVSLTAAPANAVLPDGQQVPMWGYTCGSGAGAPTGGASCSALNSGAGSNWSPVLVTVPYDPAGTTLQITLINNLTFPTGGSPASNPVPTSLVIVGQLGGGLGNTPVTTVSPPHEAKGVTWPASGPAIVSSCAPGGDPAGNGTFCPPGQPNRVQSFATEVTPGTPALLTWSSLKPGTYLIESGTHPSIQGPMGLYGVLVVTTPASGSTPAQAYPGVPPGAPVTYDADATLLFSEIDPLQNQAVAIAVGTAGFLETNVWSGQTGKCGDPAAAVGVLNTCYPPAVNYDPRYYLINGISFDRSNPAASSLPVLTPTTPGGTVAVGTGQVLLRLVNAGLRMHVPAVVGRNLTLYAEDGNVLPGVPKIQSDVFLAAGKTYDVGIKPATTGTNYNPATYAAYDRQLSLSTNNQRDGGMLAYLNVAGATTGAGTPSAAVTVAANPDNYFLVTGNALTVSDPAKGLIANDIGVYGVALLAPPSGGAVTINADGTFSYTPNSGTTSDSFTYCANVPVVPGAPPTCAGKSATVNLAQCTGSCLGAAPHANGDAYTSNIATRLQVGSPGVLQNDVDPSGLPLSADPASVANVSAGLTVTLGKDGSFVATASGGGSYSFTYKARNSQNTVSTAATVNLTFMPASGLGIKVVDAKTLGEITDYRWIIEEDSTFAIDPKCQINSTDPTLRPASCPPLPVQSLGYNFHTSNMPVVATGCVGAVSCEQGQTILGTTAVACDVGDGQCRTGTDQKVTVTPDQVHLDPNKRYYISVLPGDAVNPVMSGAGGSPDGVRPFNIATDCGAYDPSSPSWTPGGPTDGYPDGTFGCGHMMGGAQISAQQITAGATAILRIVLQETPAPAAKITAFVFQDDNPLNGENDAGGGVDVIAPNEPGLGGFEIKLFDQAGGLGDATGQITYDMFGQPVSNALAGSKDPISGADACPITQRTDGLVGMVPTCPTLESDGSASPLAGQVVIANLYPGLYEIQAYPAADRIARGEEWLQTNTLDGGKPHEAFLKNEEPAYFQEFGPGGFHVVIGFANPKVINDRRHNSRGTGMCDPTPNGGGMTCAASLTGHVTNAHMSRTPDQRIFSSGTFDADSYTQCYVGLGAPDQADFAFAKCDADGSFTLNNIPTGDFKLTVFDQWNDLMLDGLVSPVKVAAGTNTVDFPVTQWRSNLYTRTYLDANGDGVSQDDTESGLPLVSTNIRYRDGSYGFFNNTDLNGFAGFNEVFPFMNWLVLEADTTRYKVTGVHTVNDTGGQVDGAGIAANVASTVELNSLPINLRVPGAVYCASADCGGASIGSGPYYTHSRSDSGPTTGLSSGRIDPPGTTTEAWQGLLGQSDYVEFGVKPFVAGENGGIKGHVIYASTRPFDDPTLLLQLSWEPGVPHVKINLYQEGTAADGTTTLKLVDTTTSSSWDDFVQGFRSDGIPNMNCPGQDPTSPFFATLQGSTQWLDPSNPKKPLPNGSQFKCYDGWSMLNQVQPAPYDGMYKFPSVTTVDPVSGRPTGTNCTICNTKLNPDDGNPMLPAGKYVVEVIVPPGYELVKEEDKNIFLGDTYIAPVTQQFAGFGNVFIMPDQAAVNAAYNRNNSLNPTSDLGASPRHEGDTGSVESFWPCVGAERIVPDFNSLFPTSGQNSPFAGATRHLCDRKEVILEDQSAALAKFYIFTSAHVAGHFTGTITNDFASEFDPFSPQFGEKFGPPNVPVAVRDYTGNEMGRVYSDQWGIYNGLNYSSFAVNPPNPTGYIPQMMIACMNDPGPIPDPAGPDPVTHEVRMITDPNYNPAYSNFCYEQPFMPGFTSYMDTPVIPTQAFADGYNLPDVEYPDGTPAIGSVVNNDFRGPWVPASGPVTTVTLTNSGTGFNGAPSVAFNDVPGANGSGATATAIMGVANVVVTNGGSYPLLTPTATFPVPPCGVLNGTTCVRATGTVSMTGSGTSRRVRAVNITNAGAGYNSAPVVVTFSSGSAAASATRLGLLTVALTSGGSNYDAPPLVAFTGGGGTGAAATAAISLTPNGSLTITALGDKIVQNPAYSGPSATGAPYNQKTITRHYGFGAQGPNSSITIGGVTAPVTSWSDMSIVVPVPAGLPTCPVAQRSAGASVSLCGELVITAASGKKSIDAITVTAGGKAPTYIAGPDNTGHTIQNVIDAAAPGDLILIGPGTYKENLLMWKPVRLQGVGSGAVTINADAHPAGKMDSWRRQVNCLFGLTIDGVPNPNNAHFDPAGTFTCPDTMFLRDDRIPFEGFVGWDASSNGNLAQLLQEPTLMGAYEGAGVTVLGRGVRVPNGSPDLWGQPQQGGVGAGEFPVGSRYLSGSNTDCTVTAGRTMYDYGTSNFYCNPSRIDGLSIINSSQGGGAIFIHGWNHNLQVGNNRISANHGTLSGGINLGNGETPPAYINDGTICGPGVPAPAPLCPPLQGTPPNAAIPFALNVAVHVHHNDIYNNASLGDALFSGTPSGAGGLTVSPGADNYVIDHNWIAGNLTSGDGGGMVHSGFTVNGRIANNYILFNQSVNPTLPTNGGGLAIVGASADRTLANGNECGTTTDVDCPPGIGDGTGPGLVIDSNLIMGNSAEGGSGGGLRLQQINGTEVGMSPFNPARWYDVTVTNNIIANNVAGWDGAGVSIEDSLKARLINNTIVSNDTTASAGVLFKALGAPNASSPPPGCTPTPDPTQPQNPNCLVADAPHIPQPAGLVSMVNTPNLIQSLPGLVICPAGFNYGGATDSLLSRTNGLCRRISLPQVANDMFWQNRAFHVGYADASGAEVTNPVKGSGNVSQQNLVALFPALNQGTTGACPDGANYWDVGVRGDTSPTNHTVTGFTPVLGAPSINPTLYVNNSILTANPAGYVNGSGNQVPAGSPVVAQYCNGSRVPPENGGHGYNTPAGRSETTGLSPVFTFNNIAPAATVDEGNNWINLIYGPLTLFSAAGQDMVGGALDGFTLGAYSTPPTATAAVDKGLNSASPNADFFGNQRPHSANNPVDIGAVETVFVQRLAVTVNPSPLAFGVVARNTTVIQNLTIANTGNTDLAGLSVTGFAAPFTRLTTGTFPAGAPNCGTALTAGASCTVKVQFAPTANQAYSGSVIVGATGATIIGSPVAVSGTGANPATVGITPSPLTITLPRGSFTSTGIATLTNTAAAGSAGVTVSSVSVSGGSPLTYSFLVGALAGPDNCTGTTLAPGASCTVTVRFANVTSARGQNRAGTITFTDTGAGSPQSSGLIGFATP